MSKILREPLLHFLVLGAGLFFLFAWTNDDALEAPDTIVVDAIRIETLKAQFERTWQRPPTPGELNGLVNAWIREEVLYREGVALGLDQDDPVMRRRVAQKMEFISEELLDAEPAEEELEAWFADNVEAYRFEPRLSFRQLYFDPAVYGDSLGDVIARARAAAERGESTVGDATLLPGALADASLAEIRRTFGQRFADSLMDQPVGEWTGPVESGYGVHLVLVDSRQESRLPSFDEVRAAVERDFRAARTREAKDSLYEALRERYTVKYEDGVAMAEERNSPDIVQ